MPFTGGQSGSLIATATMASESSAGSSISVSTYIPSDETTCLTQIKESGRIGNEDGSEPGLLMNRIDIARLTEVDSSEAFGLARLAFGNVSPARWRILIKRWTRRPEGSDGALVARDQARRLVGLAPFQVRSNLRSGRVLWVERIIGFALLDAAPVNNALALGLVQIARTLNCEGMDVAIETRDEALRAALGAVQALRESSLVHCQVRT